MKLSNDTLSVLKNFSRINPSLVFNQGNVVRTISPQKTVMASAVVSETFDTKACVYDLGRFIAVLSQFDEPEIQFGESAFTIEANIENDQSYLRYTYASENMVVTPPNKDIEVPSPEAVVKVKWSALERVKNLAGVLQLPEINFNSNGGTITLGAVDSKNSTADNYKVVVAEGVDCEDFNMIIKVDNINLMPADYYEVALSSKGMAHFKSEKVQYWIAVTAA